MDDQGVEPPRFHPLAIQSANALLTGSKHKNQQLFSCFLASSISSTHTGEASAETDRHTTKKIGTCGSSTLGVKERTRVLTGPAQGQPDIAS